MDKNHYPEEHELQKIREWNYKDFKGLIDYVRERWKYADDGYWKVEGDVYYISTGGWSGNESIISALRESMMFWAICWQSSERGGHYVFEVKTLKEK